MSVDRVLLVGMMGAGKSTVGQALSELVGWPYLDNDTLVVLAAGHGAPEVMATTGADGLHARESAALTVALNEPAPLIASVAGGVVLDASDRARLTEAPGVVWLRASVATLAHRVGTGEGRAWLHPGQDPTDVLTELSAEREDGYREVADLVINVDDLAPGAVANQIVAAFDLPEIA